jgi:hypothetical protein
MGEIKCDECAEAGLNIGDEEICPIEAIPALPGRRCVQRSSRVAIAGNGAMQPGFGVIAELGGHRDGNGRIETAVPERGKFRAWLASGHAILGDDALIDVDT